MTLAKEWIRITSQTAVPTPGGGGHMEDGVWVPDSGTGTSTEVVVTEQRANVQDMKAVIARDTSGVPVETADAKVFLTNRKVIGAIQIGMPCVVTWKDGTTQDAEVSGTRWLDGVVFLRFL